MNNSCGQKDIFSYEFTINLCSSVNSWNGLCVLFRQEYFFIADVVSNCFGVWSPGDVRDTAQWSSGPLCKRCMSNSGAGLYFRWHLDCQPVAPAIAPALRFSCASCLHSVAVPSVGCWTRRHTSSSTCPPLHDCSAAATWEGVCLWSEGWAGPTLWVWADLATPPAPSVLS